MPLGAGALSRCFRPMRRLLVPALIALAAPASASAQELAFVSERDGNPEIYVMAGDGSGQRNVTNDAAEDQAPAWSPDGAQIAFVRGFGTEADVWVINVDGSGGRKLFGDEGAERAPAWSPDGRRIAFVSERSGGAEVHIMNADGSGVVQVTRTGGAAAQPSWSPDGTQLAYWREDTAEIHVVGPDGSGDRAVGGSSQQADRDPTWAPDGDRLAFATLRDPANDLDIYAMRLDGSGQAPLVATAAREMEPAWSPDGRLAFSTDRDGDLDVWAGDRRLTTAAGDDSQPAWKPPAISAALGVVGGPSSDPGSGSASGPASRTTIGRSGSIRVELLRSRVEIRNGRLIVTLRFRLNVRARGTYRVHHRGRVVLKRRHTGRRGVNVLLMSRRISDPKRWRGVYRASVVDLRRVFSG